MGHNAVIQRNALKSWTLLDPDVEVILFGDEQGAAETARDLGIRHVPEVERTPEGTKILRSFFDPAQRMARHDVLCYLNCDIVLTSDFLKALSVLRASRAIFLYGRASLGHGRSYIPSIFPFRTGPSRSGILLSSKDSSNRGTGSTTLSFLEVSIWASSLPLS